MNSIKGRDVRPGLTIKSSGHWYKVIQVTRVITPGNFAEIFVADMRGQMHPLLISRPDDYPVRSPA